MARLMNQRSGIRQLVAAQEKAQAGRLVAASICAMIVSAAAVVLLGISAWFLTSSAIAGLAGSVVAMTFNYMVPSAMIRMLAILRTGGRYGERVIGHDAALHALAKLRPQLFDNITRTDPAISLGLSSGETSTRLLQDVDAIQNRFVRLSAPWGAGAALLAGIILCAFASPITALTVAAIGGVYILVAITLARFATEKPGRDTRMAAGAFKHELTTLMAAAPELRAYGMTQQARDQILASANLYETAQRRLSIGSGWQGLCQTLAMAIAVVAVFVTAASQPAALIALALLGSIAVLDAAGTLIGTLSHKGSIDAAMERLEPLVCAPEDNTDAPLQPRIDIYGQYVLDTHGRLGIGGPSGSGKTTLVEQLMHLRPVVSGTIRLDGHDLGDVNPQQARALFSYAPQQAQFITGTVAQNLRLAAPKASDEELWAALEDACLAQRLRLSSQGLDMPLGENARYLSGGERRRLGLARAYLRDAPFLVLDEPTEGLDAATEARIIERLDTRLKRTGQGLILISHRPAPLKLCNEIGIVSGRDAVGRVEIHVPAQAETRSQTRVV